MTILTLCVLHILYLSSCKSSQPIATVGNTIVKANKSEKKMADTLYKGLIDGREVIYEKVRAIRNDKSIKDSMRTALKSQYETTAESFNKTYSKIIGAIDSNLIKKGRCVFLGYKRVLAPYEYEFQQDSDKGNIFIANSTIALKQSGNLSIGWDTIVLPILKAIADERIQFCKGEINKMTFAKWDEIK